MREVFVQVVWEQRRYIPQQLRTTDGRSVVPIKPGTRNQGQGPDFLQAELVIGDTRWAGHVEVHMNGADWYHHNHHSDAGYNSVIAHVVWIPTGKPVMRQDGTCIPEIVLAECTDPYSIRGFNYLFESQFELPCKEVISRVPAIHRMAAFESYGTERLLNKSEGLVHLISRLSGDWEQAFWVMLAGVWAGPANRTAFEQMALALPLKVIRQVPSLRAKESLLLGMCGLLEANLNNTEAEVFQQEWRFWKHKWQLVSLPNGLLKFGGLRPAQFPTLRLAQLAALLHVSHRLDILLDRTERLHEVLNGLRPSEFWLTHYTLEKSSKASDKALGKQFIDHLLINAVAPIRWVYLNHVQRKSSSHELTEFLNEVPPESNRITRLFVSSGVKPRTALETQAMIHLYKLYCTERRCLECQIGYFIIRSFKSLESC